MQWLLEHATHQNAIIVLLCAMVVLLFLILRKVTQLMATVTDVLNKLGELKTVEAGVVLLLDDIAQRLKSAGTDQAALQSVLDTIEVMKQDAGAAIARNTPADTPKTNEGEPPPVVPPPGSTEGPGH